jgi:sodium-dependent dicarboxylate transporter 2/3/5
MNLQGGARPRTRASLALAALVYAAAPPPDALRAGLALFVLIGSLWMTQALPLSISALMVPLLAVLTGLMGVREALAPFAHPIIFLFLGGFALAAALERHGLDRALALAVLRLAG